MKNDLVTLLVKSGGRVLGPYNRDEVLGLLRSREVAILDEVCQPFRRWQSIKTHSLFARVVDELIQASHDAADMTMTTTASDQLTESVTLGEDEHRREELNDKTPNFGSTMREIVYDNIEDKVDTKPSPHVRSRYQMAGRASPHVEKLTQKTTGALWAFTTLIVVGILGFVAYQRLVVLPSRARQVASDSFREGESAMRAGDYAGALAAFKRINADHPQIKTADYYLGLLLIQVEGQTLVGKRFLSQVLSHSPERKIEVLTGMGLAELYDGNLGNARDYFKKALQEQPNAAEAEFNFAVTEYLEGSFSDAFGRMTHLQTQNFNEGIGSLFMAQLSVLLQRQPGNPDMSNQISRNLAMFSERYFDYRQEAALVKAYSEMKKAANLEENVRAVLDIDPQLTENHIHSLLLFRKPAEWSNLLAWCQQLAGEQSRESFLSALQALCLIKSDRQQEARAAAERAIAQNPRDAQALGIYAYVLDRSGQSEQASLALGKAVEFNHGRNFELPSVLQAQFCLQSQDWECVFKSAADLIERNPSSLQGYTLKAAYALKMKSGDLAANLKKAQKLSSNYRPLRQIQERARDLRLIEE